MLGDGEVGVVVIAGHDPVKVSGQFSSYLARSRSHIMCYLCEAMMRLVVVVDGLVKGLIVAWAGGEVVVPVVLVVVGTLEKVGGVVSGGHDGTRSSMQWLLQLF